MKSTNNKQKMCTVLVFLVGNAYWLEGAIKEFQVSKQLCRHKAYEIYVQINFNLNLFSPSKIFPDLRFYEVPSGKDY